MNCKKDTLQEHNNLQYYNLIFFQQNLINIL